MSEADALRQYEALLMGHIHTVRLSGTMSVSRTAGSDKDDEADQTVIEQGLIKEKEKEALSVIRYAVTSLLRWKPQEAMDLMTPELLQRICLFPFLKYIVYPPDVNRRADAWYPIHKAFPYDTVYNPERQILSVYRRVEKGEIKEFPRYLFAAHGEWKLGVLLRDYLSRHIFITDVGPLYAMFADPCQGNRILVKARLYYAYRICYQSPLEYLHDALGDQQDTFLYGCYQYYGILQMKYKDRHGQVLPWNTRPDQCPFLPEDRPNAYAYGDSPSEAQQHRDS